MTYDLNLTERGAAMKHTVSRRRFLQAASCIGSLGVGSAMRAQGEAARAAQNETAAQESAASKPSALDEDNLRALFDKAMRLSGVVGAQMAIIKGDQIVEIAGGFADALNGVPMTVDSIIQIGSTTKVLNALTVMSVVDEGLLDIDAPVKTYIPYLKLSDPAATETITIRQLLSMSSGVDNGPYKKYGSGDDAIERYMRTLGNLPQHFTPGAHYGYSNCGTVMAGHAAANVKGQTWEALLSERVLEPAGLERFAHFRSQLGERTVSLGHELRDGRPPKTIRPFLDEVRCTGPSGAAMAMAMGDLVRIAKLFLRKGQTESGAQVLPSSTIDFMMERQIDKPSRRYGDAWCMGPAYANWNGIDVWGHPGGTETALTFMHWAPALDGAIAFAVNTSSGVGPFAEVMFTEVLEEAFGFSKPSFTEPDPDLKPIDHARYVGKYRKIDRHIDVKLEGDGLIATYTDNYFGVFYKKTALLKPLGRDRFLVTDPDRQGGYPSDTAFFGEDDQGRAKNMLENVFPTSRVA